MHSVLRYLVGVEMLERSQREVLGDVEGVP